jgi:hypothetical protein
MNRARGRRGPTRRRASLVLALAVTAGVVGFTAIFSFLSVHAYGGTSDKATVILEGQAIAHGNVLLKGWALPLDSYWTSDALLTALLVPVVGLRPVLMNIEPSLMSALFVTAGVLVARTDASTRGARVAGAATVVVLLAFPSPMLGYFLTSGAYHVGTALWAILAFLALHRAHRRWGWAAASAACLALGMLADLDMVAFATLPVALAGVVAARRRRDWRAAAPYAVAALSSAIVAEGIRWLTVRLGGFGEVAAPPLDGARMVLVNLKNMAIVLGDFIGWRGAYGGLATSFPFQVVHVLLGALALAAVAWTAVTLAGSAARGRPPRSTRRGAGSSGEPTAAPWVLDDLLLLAMLGGAATFLFQASGTAEARYLTGSALFASLLCGRFVGRVWPSLGAQRRHVASATGLVLAAAVVAGLGSPLWRPPMPETAGQLTSWLAAHHLDEGIGDYWTASVSTVDSGGRVTVRPVHDEHGRLDRVVRMSDATWYRAQWFQFLVCSRAGYRQFDLPAALSSFGPPAHAYWIDGYDVLVWSHPLRVAGG